jgi:uncharacterized protein YfiM (DUF2279 family)
MPWRWRLVFVLCFLALPTPSRAESWWGVDKAEHLALSFLLAGAGYSAVSLLGDDPRPLRLAFSTSLALVPGVLKEIYDSGQPQNHFSGQDMTWDVIGAVTGSLAALAVDLLIERLRKKRAARLLLYFSLNRAGLQAAF